MNNSRPIPLDSKEKNSNPVFLEGEQPDDGGRTGGREILIS